MFSSKFIVENLAVRSRKTPSAISAEKRKERGAQKSQKHVTIEAINGLKSGVKVQLRVVCNQSTAGVLEAESGLCERKGGIESNLLSTKSSLAHPKRTKT